MPTPISKAEAARRRSVSRAAVTQACRDGGPLAAALLPSGRLDASHPAYIGWARGDSPPRPPPEPPPRATSASPGGLAERFPGPPNITDVLEWSVREVTDRFGSEAGFGDWIDDRKKIADTHRIELQNEATLERVIDRELVENAVFGYLHALSKRLLRDVSKTIASRVASLARGNTPLKELEVVVRDLISATIHDTKTQIEKGLKQSKKGTNADGEPPNPAGKHEPAPDR